MLLALSSVLLAQLVIVLEDARGIETHERAEIVEILEQAAKEITPAATSTVQVRLIGAPSRIRVIGALEGTTPAREQVDLSRETGSWRGALEGLLVRLVPASTPPLTQALLPPAPKAAVGPPGPPIEPAPPRWALGPWIAFGASAVLLATGLGFGASSQAARTEGSTRPHNLEEQAALQDRLYAHGLAANLLFAAAGIGVVAGTLLVFEVLP